MYSATQEAFQLNEKVLGVKHLVCKDYSISVGAVLKNIQRKKKDDHTHIHTEKMEMLAPLFWGAWGSPF